jgi:prepilin-type N-terminal cleavage/methylation domain-containing protein
MRRIAKCAGMTLIEIIAALAISGLALLGAILLLHQLTDTGARIGLSASTQASERNGARLLRQLLLDSFVTADSADWVRGDGQSVSLATSCQTSRGWRASCHAMLLVDSRRDSSVIFAETDVGESAALVRVAGVVTFAYFDAYAPDSAWTSHWSAGARMPAALGVLIGRDTIVYPIGAARE